MGQVECENNKYATDSLLSQIRNGKEYYEVRLESIGGLGANLCGKMLGELGVKYLGLNSVSFSSYGSEKTGTPVKGHIRYCDEKNEIRVHSPVVEPDMLVIFHEALLRDKATLNGCGNETSIIVALDTTTNQLEVKDSTVGVWYGVEAQRIAMDTHSRINVVMLGAVLKVMGVEDISVGEMICVDTLGKKYPETLENNISGLRRGYEEVRPLNIKSKKENDSDKGSKNQTVWGYDNSPLGGINPSIGNSVISDLSPSRQGYIPLFIKEKCINCGLCHSTCPDMVFQFSMGEYKGKEMMVNRGLDYYHCKGCLRCVDVCPVNALVRGIESEHPHKQYFIVNQELLRMPEYYEKAGADGYITSESYLTEERMEGGEV